MLGTGDDDQIFISSVAVSQCRSKKKLRKNVLFKAYAVNRESLVLGILILMCCALPNSVTTSAVSSTVCSFVRWVSSCLPCQTHRAAIRIIVKCLETITNDIKPQVICSFLLFQQLPVCSTLKRTF